MSIQDDAVTPGDIADTIARLTRERDEARARCTRMEKAIGWTLVFGNGADGEWRHALRLLSAAIDGEGEVPAGDSICDD